MPLSPDLLAAYENAEYRVFADRDFVLRIGEPSPELDALLEFHRATTAVYVSAANPRGEQRSETDNAAATTALQSLIAAAGYPRYMGEGRDAGGSWREASLLVIGMYRENAIALGRLFQQNAIVFVERGGAAELIFTGSEP